MIIFGNADCGKYLTASAFLVFFMSVSSVTSSMLNSMGKEKIVLVFTASSGVLMIASIWFLPKVIGVYALLVGFSFVYVLTTILNFVLLDKVCPEKPKYAKFLVICALLEVPACLFGLMLEKLFLPIFGTFFTFVFTAGLSTVFIWLLYLGFGLFSAETIRTKMGVKKRRSPANPA